MSESKSLTDAVRDALVKKQSAQHPDAKKVDSNTKKSRSNNFQKGPPVRRSTGRGG